MQLYLHYCIFHFLKFYLVFSHLAWLLYGHTLFIDVKFLLLAYQMLCPENPTAGISAAHGCSSSHVAPRCLCAL